MNIRENESAVMNSEIDTRMKDIRIDTLNNHPNN